MWNIVNVVTQNRAELNLAPRHRKPPFCFLLAPLWALGDVLRHHTSSSLLLGLAWSALVLDAAGSGQRSSCDLKLQELSSPGDRLNPSWPCHYSYSGGHQGTQWGQRQTYQGNFQARINAMDRGTQWAYSPWGSKADTTEPLYFHQGTNRDHLSLPLPTSATQLRPHSPFSSVLWTVQSPKSVTNIIFIKSSYPQSNYSPWCTDSPFKLSPVHHLLSLFIAPVILQAFVIFHLN